MASQGCIDDARGEMVQSSSGGGQAMATMKMPRLALLTLVSADVVEQCRFFFTYYTQVEHLPPSDLFVVQAGAKLELRRCYEAVVPPLNIVALNSTARIRPRSSMLLHERAMHANRTGTLALGEGSGFNMRL